MLRCLRVKFSDCKMNPLQCCQQSNTCLFQRRPLSKEARCSLWPPPLLCITTYFKRKQWLCVIHYYSVPCLQHKYCYSPPLGATEKPRCRCCHARSWESRGTVRFAAVLFTFADESRHKQLRIRAEDVVEWKRGPIVVNGRKRTPHKINAWNDIGSPEREKRIIHCRTNGRTEPSTSA